MLKHTQQNSQTERRQSKGGSLKSDYQGPLASGLNRRAFLKTSAALSLLGGLAACKPSVPESVNSISSVERSLTSDQLTKQSVAEPGKTQAFFNSQQREILDAVQMQLFPDDGNGPSAQDINALDYLDWAMNDPQNIDDGDGEFFIKGIGWLNDLAEQTQGEQFVRLSAKQQDKVLTQIAGSNAGENWLSLLIYYLTEALMLDPIYGGNPDKIGWAWLQHQAGFPAPVSGKTYRDFE